MYIFVFVSLWCRWVGWFQVQCRQSWSEGERGPVWVCDGILMLLRLLLCFLQPPSLSLSPSSPPAWQWWWWLFDRFQWIWSLVGSARIIWQQRHRSLARAAYSYVLAPTPMQLPLFPNIQIDPVSNMQPRATALFGLSLSVYQLHIRVEFSSTRGYVWSYCISSSFQEDDDRHKCIRYSLASITDWQCLHEALWFMICPMSFNVSFKIFAF